MGTKVSTLGVCPRLDSLQQEIPKAETEPRDLAASMEAQIVQGHSHFVALIPLPGFLQA